MFCLVTGGSGSGKSAFAEGLITQEKADENLYIATMMCFDEESRKRVLRHRKMRENKHFITIERYLDLKGLCLDQAVAKLSKDQEIVDLSRGITETGSKRTEKKRAVLLECMSNLAANEMFDPKGSGDRAEQEILEGIARLLSQCHTLVVVTNEIFSDGIRYDADTMRYQKLLGAVNRQMAGMADRVVEVVYGIPIELKREPFGYR